MSLPKINSFFLLVLILPSLSSAYSNHTLAHDHPNPESVVQHLNWKVNASLSRKQLATADSCLTGNPIDDCWRCHPNWSNDRQRLAKCGIGFGFNALGGKGGPIYTVTDPKNLKFGTLRYAVSRPGPMWIYFSGDMVIRLLHPLVVTSFKTIDGRGARVGVTGSGCIVVKKAVHVIIHNIYVYGCVPADESDGDGIHIFNSANVWVDHCTLTNCAGGSVACTMGSTAVTVSNSYFYKQEKVMMLGNDDEYVQDKKMQVTVAFNRFGEGLVEQLPRCRLGYFHVVNNDYLSWGIYAVGGSAGPTINSQGNRCIAPVDRNSKEVTKRMDTDKNKWNKWDWRTEGDILVNGAFFVPSGVGARTKYPLASSLSSKSATFIDHLTLNAGLLLPNGGSTLGANPDTSTPSGISSGGGYGGYRGGGLVVAGASGTENTNGVMYSKATIIPLPRQLASMILSCLLILTFFLLF